MQKLRSMRMRNLFRVAKAVEPIEPTQTQTQTQEPTQPTEPIVKAPTVDFEALISKARQEEKDKLYPEINKLKGEQEKKVTRINELLIVIGEKDETIKQKDSEIAELKKANSTKSDSEEVKTLKLKLAELENNLAIKDQEVSQIKLESYKTNKIVEVRNSGADLIQELVYGNSPEEIDASIELAKAKYAEIANRVKGTVVVNPTKPSTEIPPANPNLGTFQTQVEGLTNGRVNMFDPKQRAQYAEMRAKMGVTK